MTGVEVEREPLSGDAALAVKDVTVRFGGITALERVSLDVRDGEVLGVIGPERRRQDDALQLHLRLRATAVGRDRVARLAARADAPGPPRE